MVKMKVFIMYPKSYKIFYGDCTSDKTSISLL